MYRAIFNFVISPLNFFFLPRRLNNGFLFKSLGFLLFPYIRGFKLPVVLSILPLYWNFFAERSIHCQYGWKVAIFNFVISKYHNFPYLSKLISSPSRFKFIPLYYTRYFESRFYFFLATRSKESTHDIYLYLSILPLGITTSFLTIF